MAAYDAAIALDPNAWGPLINMGDVLEISGRGSEALPFFEAAYAAMTRVYENEMVRVRPWYAELGVLIGDRYKTRGENARAESWYRHVLSYAPLHRVATSHLAQLLREQGNSPAADALCRELEVRTAQTCR
jgi:tetratricopeptide (TPR) repeat protein